MIQHTISGAVCPMRHGIILLYRRGKPIIGLVSSLPNTLLRGKRTCTHRSTEVLRKWKYWRCSGWWSPHKKLYIIKLKVSTTVKLGPSYLVSPCTKVRPAIGNGECALLTPACSATGTCKFTFPNSSILWLHPFTVPSLHNFLSNPQKLEEYRRCILGPGPIRD